MSSCGVLNWTSLASNTGLSHLAAKIFLNLDLESFGKLELVCKSWKQCIIEDTLWRNKLMALAKATSRNPRLIKEALLDITDKEALRKKCKFLCRIMTVRVDTNINSEIFITHLAENGILVCGHRDGTVSLVDLDRMEVVDSSKAHDGHILSLASNSRYILCGSGDGNASLFSHSLELVTRLTRPLVGHPIISCSMNSDHFAIGTVGNVCIYTACDSPQQLSWVNGGLFRMGSHLLRPSGSRLWATSDHDIILYEDGVEKKRLPIGEGVICLCPSSDGRTIWVGTWNGNLFSCDASSCQVTRIPIHLEGEIISQIEEAEGGKKFIALCKTGFFVVSTVDWSMQVFSVPPYFFDNTEDWKRISHFSVKEDDVVIFGDEHGKVRCAPV